MLGLKLGHEVKSQKKTGVCSGGHIYPIIMKLGQNVCLDEISDKYENRSCRVKNYSTVAANLREVTHQARFSNIFRTYFP